MDNKVKVDFKTRQVLRFGESPSCGDCSGSGKVLMLKETIHDRVPSVQPDGMTMTTKIVEIYKYEPCRFCRGTGIRK